MTLILALPVQGGIIMASDSQITSGVVRTTGDKLYELNGRTIWGASGELALIQRVQERLAPALQTYIPLQQYRSHLTEAIKQSVTELLNEDFRTPFFNTNPEVLLQLHPGDFLFAECPTQGQESRILHITSSGTAEWIVGNPFATGIGDLFAYALLVKYDLSQLDIQRAKVLALKVIEEAIHVGAYGLGPPVQLYEITELQARRIVEPEIAGLTDTARLIREQERSLFLPPPKP